MIINLRFLVTLGLLLIPEIFGFLDSYFYMIPPLGIISIHDSYNNESTVIRITDQPAIVEYEDEIPSIIQGYLVLSYPIDACTNVRPPPQTWNILNSEVVDSIKHDDHDDHDDVDKKDVVLSSKKFLEKQELLNFSTSDMDWILLAIKSNSCSYKTKLEYADAGGYDGLVIFNVGSNNTEVIGIEEEELGEPFQLPIPAFFIGEYDGEVLKTKYISKEHEENNRFFIRITTRPPRFRDLVYYIGWSFLGLFLFIITVCAARPIYNCLIEPWCQRHYRHRRKILLTEAVSSLAIIEFKSILQDKYETCVICMENYQENDLLRVMSCNHGFHVNCIDSWLLKVRRICPICKTKVIYSSCWEDYSDSDISDGNYFTDIAYEPLTGLNRRNNSMLHQTQPTEFPDDVDDFDIENPGSTSTFDTCSSSTTYSSLSLNSSVKSTNNEQHIQPISASFVSCTVSVHQSRESRRLSISSESIQ